MDEEEDLLYNAAVHRYSVFVLLVSSRKKPIRSNIVAFRWAIHSASALANEDLGMEGQRAVSRFGPGDTNGHILRKKVGTR